MFLWPAMSRAEQGKLTGMWTGVYSYPKETGQDPVKFQMVIIQDGTTVVGFIKEKNTFGKRDEPWLHATFKGSFDVKTGKLTFTKTYDGTAGADHDVAYSGQSKDGKVEGAWTIGMAGQADFSGAFTLDKLLTLENWK
jgi:hypothetical protein